MKQEIVPEIAKAQTRHLNPSLSILFINFVEDSPDDVVRIRTCIAPRSPGQKENHSKHADDKAPHDWLMFHHFSVPLQNTNPTCIPMHEERDVEKGAQ
jgi:hypothetical protein